MLQERTLASGSESENKIIWPAAKNVRNNGTVGLRLLQSWRDKVHALLLQNAAAELASRREIEDLQVREAEIKERMEKQSVETRILQHSLEDRHAQLQLALADAEAGREEIVISRLRIEKLEAELVKRDRDAASVADKIQAAATTFAEKSLSVRAATGQLALLDQRISFAIDRTSTLAHVLSLQSKHQTNNQDSVDSPNAVTTAADTSDVDNRDERVLAVLRAELERTTKERDFLVLRTREDAETLTSRTEAARAEFAAELAFAVATAEKLGAQVTTAEAASAAAESQVHELTARLSEAEADKEALIARTSDAEAAADKKHEAYVAALRDDYEAQLNDARAKSDATRIELGQITAELSAARREVQRAHDKAEADESTRCDELRTRVAELETQIRSISKDRQTLIATLQHFQESARLASMQNAVATDAPEPPMPSHPPKSQQPPSPPLIGRRLAPVKASPPPRRSPARTNWQPAPQYDSDGDDTPRQGPPMATAGDARLRAPYEVVTRPEGKDDVIQAREALLELQELSARLLGENCAPTL